MQRNRTRGTLTPTADAYETAVGLNCVPITTPARTEHFAAKENNGTDDHARKDERQAHDRKGVCQTKSLRGEVVEHLSDFVLHVLHKAKSMPAAGKASFARGIESRKITHMEWYFSEENSLNRSRLSGKKDRAKTPLFVQFLNKITDTLCLSTCVIWAIFAKTSLC